MLPMKLVYVEWLDSLGCDGWQRVETLAEDGNMLHKSVGWLLTDKKEFITIVPHLRMNEKSGRGDMQIPRPAITKIKTLKP
jgi:hypothetical protein